MKPLAVLAVLLAAAAAGCGGTKTLTVTQTVTKTVTKTTTTPPAPSAAAACSGTDLGGSFDAVPGSAGAGQISYALTVTNSSASACFVSGIPQLQLLDAQGGAVPTTVSAEQPGQGTAAKVVLQPGASATAQARFSPDVPGPGDSQQPGPCEPTSHQLTVTIGGGTVTVPVSPPTPVCEHGSLRMTLFAAG